MAIPPNCFCGIHGLGNWARCIILAQARNHLKPVGRRQCRWCARSRAGKSCPRPGPVGPDCHGTQVLLQLCRLGYRLRQSSEGHKACAVRLNRLICCGLAAFENVVGVVQRLFAATGAMVCIAAVSPRLLVDGPSIIAKTEMQPKAITMSSRSCFSS
jgi:hypothetical protein